MRDHHPVVGRFELRVERLALLGADGQVLVFCPEGSERR
jgi:hypothetical protein